MKRCGLATLALLFCLALPTRAEEQPLARYDLELSRILWRQTHLLLDTGKAIDNWSRGRRDGQATAKKLEEYLGRAEGLEREVSAVVVPDGGSALGGAAEQVARSRVALIQEALQFVVRGDSSKSAMGGFLMKTVGTGTRAQEQWLGARLGLVAALLGTAPSLDLQYYYQWQAGLLPLQVDLARLAGEVQLLILVEDEEAGDLRQRAARATRAGVAVRQRAESVRPSPALLEAHRLALAEQVALARLCEAVELYSRDRSPESGTRIRRAALALSKRSQEAEEASLEALAAALEKR